MEDCLCELVSDFKVGSMKIHALHVIMTGDGFGSYHPFLGDIYSFLETNTDWLMERMEKLGFESPRTLEEQIKESGISEEDINDYPEDRHDQMEIVQKELLYLIGCLQEHIEKTGEEKDFVTQNKLIDYQEKIGDFELRNRRMMGKRFN